MYDMIKYKKDIHRSIMAISFRQIFLLSDSMQRTIEAIQNFVAQRLL